MYNNIFFFYDLVVGDGISKKKAITFFFCLRYYLLNEIVFIYFTKCYFTVCICKYILYICEMCLLRIIYLNYYINKMYICCIINLKYTNVLEYEFVGNEFNIFA